MLSKLSYRGRRPNRYNPGNTLANLDALDPGSHTVKTNFFNKRIGKDGELFFTPQKLDYMKKSDANRMKVLKDFIKLRTYYDKIRKTYKHAHKQIPNKT